jgi:hypothetical protein
VGKEIRLNVKLSEEDKEKLDYCVENNEMVDTASQLIRTWIRNCYRCMTDPDSCKRY